MPGIKKGTKLNVDKKLAKARSEYALAVRDHGRESDEARKAGKALADRQAERLHARVGALLATGKPERNKLKPGEAS